MGTVIRISSINCLRCEAVLRSQVYYLGELWVSSVRPEVKLQKVSFQYINDIIQEEVRNS